MSKPGRPGARKSTKKGATKGSGGQGRKSLEGKGPTPKAEDRSWHVAGKRKAAQERYAAAGGTGRPGARVAGSNPNRGGRPKQSDDTETVTGRNSVLEALRTRIPATAFYIAQRVEMDDRVKEMLSIAAHREIPVLEVTRPELDRMAGFDGVHQGVAPSSAKSMCGRSQWPYVSDVPSRYHAVASAAVPVYVHRAPSALKACAVHVSQSYIWWNSAWYPPRAST